VRVDQRVRRQLRSGPATQGAPQPGQRQQAPWRVEAVGQGAAIGQILPLGAGVAHPGHRNAIELVVATPSPVGGGHHANIDVAAPQRDGQRMEKRAR